MSFLKNLFIKKKERKYEGASLGRRLSKWNSPGTDADASLRGNLSHLRNRSRDLVRNNPVAAGALDSLVDEIVGEGIVGTIKHPDKKTQDRLNKQWRSWAESKQADFNGLQTFYGLQRLVVRSALEGGETIVKSLTKKSGFPLELQVLEGDHLSLFESKENSDGSRVYQGIEYNKKGKRIAYHLLDEHPGASTIFTNNKQTRYSVDDIAHIFRVDRNGQSRGIPFLSPVLVRIKDLDDYNDAQVVRQKIAASWAAFITDYEAGDLDDTDEIELIEKIEPGMIEILPPGKDIKFGNPPSVEGYGEFNSVHLHHIAKALGISYELLTGDFSKTNYSSGRMGHLKTQKTIRTYRKHVLKPMFLDFVKAKFFQILFLQGENIKEATMQWTAPRTEMIDPTKEIPAARDSVRAGLSTLSSEIRKGGLDPDEVMKEWKEDADRLDKDDLFFDSDPRRINRGGSLQDNLVNEDPDDNNIDVSDKSKKQEKKKEDKSKENGNDKKEKEK